MFSCCRNATVRSAAEAFHAMCIASEQRSADNSSLKIEPDLVLIEILKASYSSGRPLSVMCARSSSSTGQDARAN